MGMSLTALEFFNRSISRTLGSIHGLRMAELGDQKFWSNIRLKDNVDRVWVKEWIETQGCHHYSIDLHGRNGSHPLDLSKPIEDKFWHNNFDIVTNFGTSEHVDDQWECWRNIHNLGKPGCVYIHVIPEFKKYLKGHCKYFCDLDFFSNLASANNYTLILNESLPAIGHVGACYINPQKSLFCPSGKELMSWLKGDQTGDKPK